MNFKKPRYTRLKAITAFGYAIEWKKLAEKTLSIVGVGGLGMLSAEMMTRCGMGTIHLFDLDIVQPENLNRMGFYPADLQQPKVEVATRNLHQVNPDVRIIPHHGDIMAFDQEESLEKALRDSDIILMGLDNYPARMYLNQKCINFSKPLIDAGVSRSALSGYIHVIIPHQTACMMCRARITGKNRKQERGLPCTASLPSTMALIASVQVQEALKRLLGFGTNIQ